MFYRSGQRSSDATCHSTVRRAFITCRTLLMASHEQLVDAQFDRAVQMVQSLPKTGPIQTDYEEKLAMYR